MIWKRGSRYNLRAGHWWCVLKSMGLGVSITDNVVSSWSIRQEDFHIPMKAANQFDRGWPRAWSWRGFFSFENDFNTCLSFHYHHPLFPAFRISVIQISLGSLSHQQQYFRSLSLPPNGTLNYCTEAGCSFQYRASHPNDLKTHKTKVRVASVCVAYSNPCDEVVLERNDRSFQCKWCAARMDFPSAIKVRIPYQ